MENYISLQYVLEQLKKTSLSKKGFSLIEVICGMAIITMFIAFLFPAMADYQKEKINNEKYNEYFCFVEAVRNELYYNYSKYQIEQFSQGKTVYINSNNIGIDKIKDNPSMQNFFVNVNCGEKPYLLLNIYPNGSNTFRIVLELHYKSYSNNQIIRCEFYKGDY